MKKSTQPEAVHQNSISERLQVEQRLRERERFLRTLISNLPGIAYRCRTDARWTSEFISEGIRELSGYTPQDLTESRHVTWDDIIHPEDVGTLRAELRRQLTNYHPLDTAPLQNAYRIITADGELKHVRDRCRPVYDSNGEIIALEGFIADITKRKLAEEGLAALLVREQTARHEAELARHEAERANRAKDEFLQMVSHEFRTPLTTIKMLVRLMQHDHESEAERQEHLETIALECDRQIGMIVNLLDVSRLDEGKVDLRHERVCLAQVLRSCERIERHAAEARRQNFQMQTPHDPYFVRGDAKAIRRALCTIIENAIKYTPAGGTITLSTEHMTRLNDAGETSDEVAVHVADTGCGILPKDLPHIFEKFFRGTSPAPQDAPIDCSSDDTAGRAETSGVGLGLYLARRLIESLDGRIEVKSEVARGSRFSVYLPVWNEEKHVPDEIDEYEFNTNKERDNRPR